MKFHSAKEARAAGTEVPCVRGKMWIKHGRFSPQILTGNKRRFDSVYWSGYGSSEQGYQVAVNGLYRGKYAECIVLYKDLHNAFLNVGNMEAAQRLKNSYEAWIK